MPPWLLLILFVAGCVAFVGLQAAACMGNWRTLWLATRQFSVYLLGLSAMGALAWGWLLMWGS